MELPKRKVYRKLGYTGMDTVVIVNKLNNLLANYHIFYQKMRNFHWNVKGRDFFELHELFEKWYNSAKTDIDDIAERVRIFGSTPVSTLREYLDIAEIQEVGTDLEADLMVRETQGDLQILLSALVDVTNAAIDIGDVGTEYMVNKIINRLEKRHWMINAWLQEEYDRALPAESVN